MSVTGRLLRLFAKIGLPRRGWATGVGFGMAGTRGPKPLEAEQGATKEPPDGTSR